MKKPALAALVIVYPCTAWAYTLTLDVPQFGDVPSLFYEQSFPASSFIERPSHSEAASTNASSSFSLRNIDEGSRLKTEATLTELGAKQEDGRIIVDLPSDILFAFDKSTIRPDAQPVLAKLAAVLQTMPRSPVTIIGHTDAKGSDAYNQALSERRAASVRDWLARIGTASLMTTQGRGESSPVAENQNADGSDNPEGRQKNRRVQFVIGDQ